MTNKEAIKELKIIREDYWDEYNDPMPALDMAIKALEQEPCEDCISRAKAQTEIEMNALRYTIAKERNGMGQVEWSDQLIKVSDAVDIIRHLHSVIPQPKMEHWIEIMNNRGTVIALRCSCCGKSPKHAIKSDFCPNCGAEMMNVPDKNDGKMSEISTGSENEDKK